MDALEPANGAVAGRGIAASLLANVSSLADDMLRYLVERIPEVAGDAELRGLTLGSCSSNLEAALSMFRHGIDVAAAEAPVTALEHARAMASRGHSVDVMLRFYRLGHEYFTEKLSESLTDWMGARTIEAGKVGVAAQAAEGFIAAVQNDEPDNVTSRQDSRWIFADSPTSTRVKGRAAQCIWRRQWWLVAVAHEMAYIAYG